jgi:hypothetical protein
MNRKRTPSGCWFVAKTGLILIFMLVCNIMFVRSFFASNLSGVDDRIFQATQFILPFFLIFLQFWMYDKVRNLFDPPGRNLEDL